MKIQFESDLKYQNNAINSIVNIFEGQEVCQSNFSVSRMTDNLLHSIDNELGIGNRLELLPYEILSNVQNIQLKNGLAQSKKLDSMDFSVEMETGTGKTYVYLKSIFEMNKKYGFTKFIIVVPSIAIKEGTKKTLDITEEHFKGIFSNVNYDHFIYDSSNLEQVRDFATSSDIRIMVINIDAFKKSFTDPNKDTKANIIHRQNDRLNGQKPIEFIASTNPIVIIDEPQSVDNTTKSKEAISTLNPLCRLRYSATHTEKYNLMYKLDSIDAYEQKLVKQIEVANVQLNESSNQAYLKLQSIKATPRSAKLEIDISSNGKTTRKPITIKDGSDLYELSNGRDIYEGYTVIDIYIEEGNEYVEFGNGEIIKLGETKGDVDEDSIKRLQIRKTIEEHLEKELRLRSKGIKVLSLFFIDRVSNYRQYDEEGNPINGKFAQWFEEEYLIVAKRQKYKTLFLKESAQHKEDIGNFQGNFDKSTASASFDTEVKRIHNGYFSTDKKGKVKDSSSNVKGELKGNKDDEDTFSLIMKDKEKLLSFESPLKFIFSHSALKEGWDNPNVFQICTLNETNSIMKKRQEIGRGLRICVNQEGKRVHGFYANTLTVMANESYEDFAASLQKEIEQEEGIKFGSLQEHFFANIPIQNENGEVEYLGAKNSKNIYSYLAQKNYIDKNGKIQNSLRLDIKDNKFEVPQEYKEIQMEITSVIKKIAGNLNVKDANNKVSVKLNKQILLGDDFKELWDRIKYKTTYRVDFDVENLINTCAKKIENELTIGKIKYIYSKAKNKIIKAVVEVIKIL
jgi:type III restriction enzyme